MITYPAKLIRVLTFAVACIAPWESYSSGAEIEDTLEKIRLVLPETWQIRRVENDTLPYGRYRAFKYDDLKEISIVLSGNIDVFSKWTDSDGGSRSEALGKEAIYLVVMPGDYRSSWKRFFVAHHPILAHSILHEDQSVTVFFALSETVNQDVDITEMIAGGATDLRWPNSPRNTGILSWETWENELISVFEQFGDE